MAKRHFQKIILKENGLPPMEIRLPPSVIVGDSRTQMSGYMAEPFTPVATELNTPFATEPNTPAECMAHGAGDLSHAADPVALAAALESVNLAPRVEAVGEDIGGVAEVSEPITEAPASNSLATWATSGLTAGLPRTPLKPAFARVFGGSSPLTPLPLCYEAPTAAGLKRRRLYLIVAPPKRSRPPCYNHHRIICICSSEHVSHASGSKGWRTLCPLQCIAQNINYG
ncbi:hypothetical protein FA13DRAFT_1772100 [Coprinellus micaceus]|uniref:Uncharacterized protein n=1 Tax=Coprinellus micaceus TaxID=71717 RepID=A0A4Y7TQB1_COPMI|nr:hypothetical protein FA13DRAFT_1772100 [Coprinellus micaceus]